MALTDYEKYIRTEELLRLQKPPETLTCHDEMQFQIVHQAHELYMKLIEHELRFVATLLSADETARAITTLGRVARIQRVLLAVDRAARHDGADRLHDDPHRARPRLGPGVAGISHDAEAARRGRVAGVRGFLERAGVTLRELYEHPHDHHELFQLAEGLVDYDQLLQMWRQRHLMLVYRIIGTGTPSLKGKHSDLLAHGMKTRFFPALWDVRDDVYAEWTAQQAAKGNDPGYHG